jgi:hypothetical protein
MIIVGGGEIKNSRLQTNQNLPHAGKEGKKWKRRKERKHYLQKINSHFLLCVAASWTDMKHEVYKLRNTERKIPVPAYVLVTQIARIEVNEIPKETFWSEHCSEDLKLWKRDDRIDTWGKGE